MKALLEKIRNILRSRKNRQVLTRSVSVVAAVVVFITTYALVLPAITMEQNAFCGIPEHQHTDSCYEERLVCGIPEGQGHHHDASCYEKFLICGLEVHVHSPECYQQGSRVLAFADGGEAVSTASGAAGQSDVLYGTDDSDYDSDALVTDGSAAGEEGMEGTASGESVSGQPSAEESDVDRTAPEGSGAEGADAEEGAAGAAAPEGLEESEGFEAGEAVSGKNVLDGSDSETASENVSEDETVTAPAGDTSGEAVSEDAAAAASTAASTASDQGTAADTQELKGTEDASFKSGTLIVEGEGYKITLEYTEKAEISENAELSVREITAETDREAYEACLEQAGQQVAVDEKTSVDRKASRFFDIEILERNTDSEGNEVIRKIEPSAPVSVNIQIIEDQTAEYDTASADQKTGLSEPAVLHFAEEGVEQLDAEVKEGLVQEQEGDKDKKSTGKVSEPAGTATEISFEAESFSIYAVVYTVDFHWEVDGKEYEFSIPGGGFVSLEHLVEVLGIAEGESSTEDKSESAEAASDDDEAAAYDEAIKLNEVQVSEATKKFMADVKSVEFSSPELVWVGRVDESAAVGALKDTNGLEIEYSADLTAEQIAEINAQTVEAGDWALISVLPFVSEETLTVTMKNGDQFAVKVTDGQISTHVITAAGEDFTITVIYGTDAEIPSNAVLEASEIVGKSKEYEKYLNQTREALKNRDALDEENPVADDTNLGDEKEENLSTDNEGAELDGSIVDCTASDYSSFSFARFFDIRIMVGKDIIEPKAPVTVKITYSDPVNVEEGEELLAVHFAEEGTEITPIRVDQESGELTFRQDSFSVTGTVVPVGQNAWPSNNGSYVLFTQIGDQYYAINHDGELVPVTCNGNRLLFEDADVLFHGMDEYLWQYERTSRYVFQQGWVNEDRLFFNVGESPNWINPANETGIGNNRTLTRINDRIRVSNGNYYITVDGGNSHIAGQGNEENAIPIYFANGFDNVNKVIVHFVDRDGNPISGVQYTKDNVNVVASPDNDGTFAIPYNWNGATGVVDLSEDFSKTGYSYASTHLSGVQTGITLKQDGLTIDAKLTERQNGNLYIGTDIGSNKDYLPYANDATDSESNVNGEWINNYSGQRRLDQTIRAAAIEANARQDYATTTDKDIYVILDPAQNTISGGGDDPTDIDADDPRFTKTLEDNGDGTYTLSLTIEGHAKSVNKSTNANVLFVVDTSSSMSGAVGNSTRIVATHDALKKLGDDLMAYNQKIANRVQVSMIAFDGGVYNRLGWTSSQSEFDTAVDEYIRSHYLHRGTDWEDALRSALTQAGTADSDPTFVIFFTDGEPSQYSNYHGANTYNNGDPVSKKYGFYFNSFLSRESCNDEARALVDSGYELYGVFAFNNSGHTYPNGEENDESDSDLLHNLVKYGYNSKQSLGADSSNQRFFPVSNQDDLEEAFDKILERINISVGFDEVQVTDNITDLTQAGFATSFDSVNDFSYYRSGNGHGTESEPWEVWEDAPQATPNVQNNSVTWELKNPDNTPMVLEDGVSYKVSFIVWPKQADFDWVANLANGTKTWDDVVEAGLDFPGGNNPQIVRTQTGTDEDNNPVYSYSIATNKPSKNGNGEIINNGISYRKIRTELLNTLPAGAEYNTPVTTVDEQGNTVITTYTQNNGVITKTVETMKTTCFDPPEPMPLNDTKMKVKKEWEDSINLGHRADYVIFNLLVDGQPYMDRTAPGKEEKEYEIRVEDSDWLNEVVIAPGVIRDGDILEEGHSYTISEEYDANGSDFYGFSFEFKSQTVRPMNIDGNLVYLIQIDDDNPAPSGAAIHAIAGRTYYEAAGDAGDAGQRYYEAEKDSTGLAALSGTNGKTSELDITKIVDEGNTNLTESDLDAETFTYRITLDIPAGSNIDGIMGYCYFEYPNGPNEPFKLFGYQPGETALESDIERFGSADNSKKIYRSWNTTNNRIQSQLMKTNGDGSITVKMDFTLTQKEVLRLTNLPSGTRYEIEEVYANYYKPASPSHSEEGQKPLDGEDERPYLAPNLAEQGYSVTQILEKNSNQTEEEKVTHTGTTVISGTISETNTRYYNQYTNELTNVTLGELKVTKHLEGYEWSGEKYYFTLTAGTADFNDGKTPETGISPMPASNRIYLSDTAGTADKTYTFGKIRYTRPGTYQYTITETDADGNVLSGTTGANGIFYAPADTVTVTVGYDDDEHLAVKKIEGSNGNTIWSTVENSAVVTGTTTFTNSIPIPIKKMDIDKKTQLSNAVFELLSGHSKLYFDPSYMILTQAQVESIIDMAVNDDGAAAAMAAEGITSTFTIGEISLKGLSLNTTYTLREIQPPDGYIIAANEATFVLSKDGEDIEITVTGENISVDEDGISIIITNIPGAALPSTGGPGTCMIYLSGIALICLATTGLAMKRRRKAA